MNLQPKVLAFKINRTGIFDPKRGILRTVKNKFSPPGIADIIGLCDGKFFAIEVKTPKSHDIAIRRPTQHDKNQADFLFSIIFSGGDALRVSDLETVQKFIKQIKARSINKEEVKDLTQTG